MHSGTDLKNVTFLDHPDIKLGNVAHDKDELAVSEQVFGKNHSLTKRIRGMVEASA